MYFYLRVVDVDGAGLPLPVETEELLPDGLGQVQGYIQRADDAGVSVGQQVLRAHSRRGGGGGVCGSVYMWVIVDGGTTEPEAKKQQKNIYTLLSH